MKRLAILSDTHGLLRPEVTAAIQVCDAILHGGDINRQEMIDTLRNIAPVYVVRGNNDKEWAESLPLSLDLTLFGLHIFMTHKKKDLPADVSGYDLVVYGHSHKYEERREGKTLFVNPGSCGPRRFNQPITLAILEINEAAGDAHVVCVDIPHDTPKSITGIGKQDIERVIREIQKGKPVSDISKNLQIQPQLTEQICRLYLTHPGVDADGIMRKMGL